MPPSIRRFWSTRRTLSSHVTVMRGASSKNSALSSDCEFESIKEGSRVLLWVQALRLSNSVPLSFPNLRRQALSWVSSFDPVTINIFNN